MLQYILILNNLVIKYTVREIMKSRFMLNYESYACRYSERPWEVRIPSQEYNLSSIANFWQFKIGEEERETKSV